MPEATSSPQLELAADAVVEAEVLVVLPEGAMHHQYGLAILREDEAQRAGDRLVRRVWHGDFVVLVSGWRYSSFVA